MSSFEESKQISKSVLPTDNGSYQELIVDNNENVLLRTQYDDDAVAKRNYEMRKENPKGNNATGSMKHRAGIPYYEFMYQPLLRDFLIYSKFGQNTEARKCLNKFLEQNPQYKTSN